MRVLTSCDKHSMSPNTLFRVGHSNGLGLLAWFDNMCKRVLTRYCDSAEAYKKHAVQEIDVLLMEQSSQMHLG